MHSMNEEAICRVIGGVDSHVDSHHAAALDDRGALLGTNSFEVSEAGYRELLGWLGSFGVIDRVGVESTGSYAAGLTRLLVAEGVRVLEVNRPHHTPSGDAGRRTRSTPKWRPGTRSASRPR